MKYSFTLFQPSPNSNCAASINSLSRYSFWITSRSRWVPASGASVKPVFRTRRISSKMCGESASTRVDGSETATFRSEKRFITDRSSGLTQL